MRALRPSPRLRRAGSIVWLLLMVVMVVGARRAFDGHDGWGVVTVTALVAAGVVLVVTWRCQHCHRYLGSSSGRGYCQHCGQLLR